MNHLVYAQYLNFYRKFAMTLPNFHAGVSLDGIWDILSEQRGDKPLPPPTRRKPGHISVCSKIVIADGIDLLIDPEHTSLSPENIRKLTRGILSFYATIQSESPSWNGPS